MISIYQLKIHVYLQRQLPTSVSLHHLDNKSLVDVISVYSDKPFTYSNWKKFLTEYWEKLGREVRNDENNKVLCVKYEHITNVLDHLIVCPDGVRLLHELTGKVSSLRDSYLSEQGHGIGYYNYDLIFNKVEVNFMDEKW